MSTDRTFTVRVNELRAVMLFASNDDSRFAINGVHIEVRAKSQPLLVATDGRRLAALESVAEQVRPAEVDFSLTLATVFLKPLCAFAKSQSAEIHFEYHPTERILCRFGDGKTFVDCEQGALIEMAFPNWRQVLPQGEKKPVPHIGVNAEYVGDFAKAAKLLNCDCPVISVNLIGKGEAMDIRIYTRPQFYGVLMPAKVDEEREWQPEFIKALGCVSAPKNDVESLEKEAP